MSTGSRAKTPQVWDFLDWLVPEGSLGGLNRIGGFGDGAYLIPDDVSGIEACFSPGVANRKDFEDEVVQRFNMRAHLMDASSDADKFRTRLENPIQTFRKTWLGPDEAAEDTVSLQSWVDELEPGASDLLLQMDIEGAEYPNLASALESVLERFRIIVLELHGLAQIATEPELFWRQKGVALTNLMQNHAVVHAHPNNCCGAVQLDHFPLQMPKVLEISLLRKDRLKGWAAGGSSNFQSPHREEIGWNVGRNRPLFLGDHWMRAGLEGQTRYRRSAIDSACLFEQELSMHN